MPRVAGVLETALHVKNLSRSEKFYRRIFGFKVLVNDKHRLCALDVCGREVLLLFKDNSTRESVPVGNSFIPGHHAKGRLHFAFAIGKKELNPWLQRLKKLKIKVISTVKWPLGGTSIYFHDPDQHLVELATPGIWKTY